MLRVSGLWLMAVESQFPGIREEIARLDSVKMPPCPHCGSGNTAVVHVGMAGHNVHLARATTKVALVLCAPAPGTHRCNGCGSFFSRP